MQLIGNQRSGSAAGARSKAQPRPMKWCARREMSGERPLLGDADFAGRLARIELDLLSLESLVLRVLHDEKAGKGPGAEASFLKIKGTEVQQGLTEIGRAHV